MSNHSRLDWLKAVIRRAIAFVHGLLWIPTDLPGCLLWLRASRGVVKTGSLVAIRVDQAGDHTVLAPSVVERPRFVGRSDAFNQRPAVRFDGIGDLLEKDDDVALPVGGDAFSVFVVLSQAAVGVANGTVVVWGDSAPRVALSVSSRNVFEAYLDGAYSSDVTLMTGKPYLLGLVYAEEKAALYVRIPGDLGTESART